MVIAIGGGVKLKKCGAIAVQCGRGQGNVQMRSRCGQKLLMGYG